MSGIQIAIGGGATPGASFRISGTFLIDPEGNPFVPRGFNIFCGLLPYPNWRTPDVFKEKTLVENWGANFIRLNMLHTGEGVLVVDQDTGKLVYDSENHATPLNTTKWPGNAPQWEDVYVLISKYTSQKIPVMLNFQGQTYPNPPTLEEQAQNLKWLAEMAARYINNPYVWFETYNERGETSGTPNEDWLHYNRMAIRTIRATGNKSPVFVTAQNYGQDIKNLTSSLDSSQSSFLTYGPQLTAEFENVGFDLHLYARFGGTPPALMAEYFRALRAAGLYVIVGEFGGHPTASRNENWLNYQATKTLLQITPNFPGAWWAETLGSPLTDTGNAGSAALAEYDSEGNPTNLTETGRLIWAWLHDVPYTPNIPEISGVETKLNPDGTRSVDFNVSPPGGTAYAVVQSGGGYPTRIEEIQRLEALGKGTAYAVKQYMGAETVAAGGSVSLNLGTPTLETGETFSNPYVCIGYVTPSGLSNVPAWTHTGSLIVTEPWVDN